MKRDGRRCFNGSRTFLINSHNFLIKPLGACKVFDTFGRQRFRSPEGS